MIGLHSLKAFAGKNQKMEVQKDVEKCQKKIQPTMHYQLSIRSTETQYNLFTEDDKKTQRYPN